MLRVAVGAASLLRVILYTALLGSAAITEPKSGWLTPWRRAVLAGTSALGCTACVLAMWLETPSWYIEKTLLRDIGTLYGIQGRHYIPFVLVALFALGTDALRCRMAWLLGAALTVIVVVNLAGLLAIRAAYYMP